ncbi:hypothetical protein NU219Hw_g1717t1 [Hortaea werneckii]
MALKAGAAAQHSLWARQSVNRTSRSEIQYPAHTIDMPIDHFPSSTRYEPHTNATFSQRYFYDDSYYKPGGPVFLYIGGETSGEYRFSNLQTGIIQILMEATNGLRVILENRYYGESYPFASSTTDELKFLTTEQVCSLNAPNAPWILYGGSLAGAQTAFSLKTYGGHDGILWGGIASSGTTKAQLAYVEWCFRGYDPIQEYGPQDCVGSINAIVDKIDFVRSTGNATAYITRTESLERTWATTPTTSKNHIVPLCDGTVIESTACFGTQNESYRAETSNSGSRSYLYSTCTESGIYQAARPYGPSLISRALQVPYTQQWCTWAFPAGEYNSIPATPELWRYNKYGGYEVVAERLARIDGEQDVWSDLCYHSSNAPGRVRVTANAEEVEKHPQLLITGAGHHWDSYGILDVAAEPQFIRGAHRWEIRIVRWLDEWKAKREIGKSK